MQAIVNLEQTVISVNSFAAGVGNVNEASAGLIYWELITGPDPSVLVPTWAEFGLKTFVRGDVPIDASAFLSVQGATPATSFNQGLISTNGSGTTDNFYVKPFSQFAGQLSKVTMTVSVSVDGGTSGFIDGQAFADPYFYIDPTWLADHPGYTLTVSAGVGNNSPDAVVNPGPGPIGGGTAPEPSSLPLLGLALLIPLMRPRQS
jgi:hypothetical protein